MRVSIAFLHVLHKYCSVNGIASPTPVLGSHRCPFQSHLKRSLKLSLLQAQHDFSEKPDFPQIFFMPEKGNLRHMPCVVVVPGFSLFKILKLHFILEAGSYCIETRSLHTTRWPIPDVPSRL